MTNLHGVELTTPVLFEKSRQTLPTAVDVDAALGMLSIFTGEQAGALLIIVQLLARDRLLSIAEARRLVSLLSSEPAIQRRVTAQLAQRKAKPLKRTTIRKPY